MIFLKSITLILHSAEWRARVGLYFGLIFNIIYAAFKLITGIVYGTLWFYAAAVYYLLLCWVKFLLIRTDRKLKGKTDRKFILLWSLRSYKRCGHLLMLLNLSMTAIILIIIKYDKTAEYSDLILWAFGAYTLTRLVLSAVDIKKLHHTLDPLLSASKHLGMSVTLMSMFSLITALLDRFCENEELRVFIKGAVGIAVSITVVIIALSMIIYSSRRIRKLTMGGR